LKTVFAFASSSNLKIFSACNEKRDACRVVVVDVVGWWINALAE